MSRHSEASPRVELGQVRINPKDAQLIQVARIRLTRWFEREPANADNSYRPARLGALLSPRQFGAWAVRYAIVRAEHEHNCWPEQILIPEHRRRILSERRIVLGACRVAPTEAAAFRRACLSFYEMICAPAEDINQSRFLTLAVVGLAECVKKTAALYNLPMPPWAGRLLFKELPRA